MKPQENLFTVLCIVAISFIAGLLAGQDVRSAPHHSFTNNESTISDADLAPVWTAWTLLDEKFVQASGTARISKEERVWGIIKGLANSYNDPYTIFMPPAESESFEQDIRGEFGGVGIEIGIRNGVITVISPLKNTPAYEVGLLPGDLIVEVDGNTTHQLSIDEVVSSIRGEVGTEVILTIAREGEDAFLTIPVVRAMIEVPTLEKEFREDGVYVISLYNFGGTAMKEFRVALRELVQTETNKVLIDLRGNPGGYLDVAVEMSSWFLPIGKTVVIEDYGTAREPVIHRSKGYDITKDDWRIAILVNEGSASASEILAGALQDHGVAVLVGEKTFGKGSVQELVNVTDNTSLKITIARWLTPNGVSLSNSGIYPDLEVIMTREDFESERDPQFEAAITYLTTGVLSQNDKGTEDLFKGVEDTSEIE